MTPKAVLFDCDGVLVDSERITNQLLSEDLSARGLAISAHEVQRLFLSGTMESARDEAAKRGAQMPADWVTLFFAKMFDALRREAEPVPGAPELVEALIARQVRLAVASNGPVEKMQITLGRTGLLEKLAPHIYSARDLGRAKPAPDIYLHAAQMLGVAPADCVVIEDSPSGAKAAMAAGIPCIGFAAEGQADALHPLCRVVVPDMDGVARALGL